MKIGACFSFFTILYALLSPLSAQNDKWAFDTQFTDYYSIVLELKTDKESLIESVLLLDQNLSRHVNILKLSPSLFGAYSIMQSDRDSLETLLEKFYPVFLSAHIVKVDPKEYQKQLILQDSELQKSEKTYRQKPGGSEYKKDFSTVIYFPLGDAALNEEAQKKLDEMSKKMGSSRHKIVIKGHTDSVPVKDDRYDNMELSRQRAQQVKEHLSHSLSKKRNHE